MPKIQQHIYQTMPESVMDCLASEQGKLRRIVALSRIDRLFVIIVEDTPESISLAEHQEHMRRGDY